MSEGTRTDLSNSEERARLNLAAARCRCSYGHRRTGRRRIVRTVRNPARGAVQIRRPARLPSNRPLRALVGNPPGQHPGLARPRPRPKAQRRPRRLHRRPLPLIQPIQEPLYQLHPTTVPTPVTLPARLFGSEGLRSVCTRIGFAWKCLDF